jgi:hypothetical protein
MVMMGIGDLPFDDLTWQLKKIPTKVADLPMNVMPSFFLPVVSSCS